MGPGGPESEALTLNRTWDSRNRSQVYAIWNIPDAPIAARKIKTVKVIGDTLYRYPFLYINIYIYIDTYTYIYICIRGKPIYIYIYTHEFVYIYIYIYL